MSYGIIGFSSPGNLNQPSPSIWGDCPNAELIDEATGYFTYWNWIDGLPANAGSIYGPYPSSAANSGTFNNDTTALTPVTVGTAPTANVNGGTTPPGVLSTTGSTANNGNLLFGRPVVLLAPGSGQKIWFECMVGLDSLTHIQGVFVGIGNRLAQVNTLIAATSATQASNTIAGTQYQSIIGFWAHGDAPTNFDAIWINQSTGTATAAPVAAVAADNLNASTVLANVLTANANNPNPGNLAYVPPTPPGVLTAINGTNGLVKLGLRYDGQQYLYYYVNGAQVAKVVVTSAFDVTTLMGPIVTHATGTANANSLHIPFVRFAAQLIP